MLDWVDLGNDLPADLIRFTTDDREVLEAAALVGGEPLLPLQELHPRGRRGEPSLAGKVPARPRRER
jgi:hypothetical protein